MPKGIPRGEACPKCGSTGTRHRKGCEADAGDVSKPERKPRGPRLVVQALDADGLLERRDELEAELADVEKLLQEQLEAQEAKLRRMREAIGAPAREAKAEVA
jgi:hypothetical protein